MRCPHCGGLNPDTSKYCIRCGRTFAPQQQNVFQPAQRPVYPPRPATPPQQSRPVYPPPSPSRPAPPERPTVTPQPPRPTVYPPTTPRTAQPVSAPSAAPARPAPRPFRPDQGSWSPEPPIPPAPEPPAPFPSHTVAQLKQLVGGALEYTVVNENTDYRSKKVVQILYRRCAQWQQVATLLKAFNDLDDKKFDTIIIQGVYNQEHTLYAFTNGQLIFDRNVRLGSQTQKRYQIETDNGYAMEAVRIVVSE
ncbi:zinc ribbon domain-containing protein [Dictyobacter halimunensis]|uniref:zinc ribbon domain-containing protein n=1 Tax=Dictyobacter halimunensis TaxID=3026934 RepID=UPI0030C66412